MYSLTDAEEAPRRERGRVGMLATLREPMPGLFRRLTLAFLEKKDPRSPMSSVDLERPGADRFDSLPLVVRRTPRDVGGRRGESIPSLEADVTEALCERLTPRALRGGRV